MKRERIRIGRQQYKHGIVCCTAQRPNSLVAAYRKAQRTNKPMSGIRNIYKSIYALNTLNLILKETRVDARIVYNNSSLISMIVWVWPCVLNASHSFSLHSIYIYAKGAVCACCCWWFQCIFQPTQQTQQWSKYLVIVLVDFLLFFSLSFSCCPFMSVLPFYFVVWFRFFTVICLYVSNCLIRLYCLDWDRGRCIRQ